MGKSIDDMYGELLEQAALFSGSSGRVGRSYVGPDEDGEDFMTSEEIAKMKKDPDGTPANFIIPAGAADIEEDVHFKLYTKRREHKYTETEMQQIRDGCVTTIVHDYSVNDRYHWTDEERERNDSLMEIQARLSKLKKTYNKVDEYICAMRTVVEAWAIVERKENMLFSTDEFYSMISEGRIYHRQILMPRLRNMDKYNIELIIQYISNPELDATDLLPPEQKEARMLQKRINDGFYDFLLEDEEGEYDEEEEETEEEMLQRLLDDDEARFIVEKSDDPPFLTVHDIPIKEIRGYDRHTLRGGKKRKPSKKKQFSQDALHAMLNKIQSNPENRPQTAMYNRSMLVTHSMFDVPKDTSDKVWDQLYFDGSWASDSDNYLLDIATREVMLTQQVSGGMTGETYADQELKKFFSIMEKAGINVLELRRLMNMSDEQQQRTSMKEERKANKKAESALLQRISKLNNSPKFKKLVAKAEKDINNELEDQ